MKTSSANLLIFDMIMDTGQKAIISSGLSKTDYVKEARDLGARKYIKKPYTLKKKGLAGKEALRKCYS